MKLRTYSLRSIDSGTRVLVRLDANVPIKNGRIVPSGTRRIDVILPELRQLIRRGARLVLMTHIGRPAGKKVASLSTKPIANYLSKALQHDVKHLPWTKGEQVQKHIDASEAGSVFVLENIRFEKGEKKNQAALAKAWAKLADMYINAGFGVCHRQHASVHAITRYLPSYASKRLVKEVRELSRRLKKPATLVVGGVKLSTKVPVIDGLAPQVTSIIAGGGVGVVLVGAERGKSLCVGDATCSQEDVNSAKRVLKRHAEKLHLPIDFKTARSTKLATKLKSGDKLYDVGPKSLKHFNDVLAGSKTVIWNGTLGDIEQMAFAKTSTQLAKTILDLPRARTVVGGGDTVAFLDKKKLGDKFTFVSSGGGAMLVFLSGDTLPGLEVLKK